MRWYRHGSPLGGGVTPGSCQRFLDDMLKAPTAACVYWPFDRNNGYARRNLAGQKVYVHNEMCREKHGPPPTADHQAAHSCGQGRAGCVNPDHLRWATPLENAADKTRHGTELRGTDHHSCRLTEEAVLSIFNSDRSNKELAATHNVSPSTVTDIWKGRTWRWLTGA